MQVEHGDSKPSPAESRKYKKRKANAMKKEIEV